jgi:hypothetical protein
MTNPPKPLLYLVGIVAIVGSMVLMRAWHRTPSIQPTQRVALGIGSDTPLAPMDPRDTTVLDRGSDQEAIRGDFLYLFDVSTSTHTGDKDDPYLRSLRILAPAINAIRQSEVLMPQRHRVGTIGAASLMQQPRCDFRAETPMFFRQSDTTQVTRRMLGCVTEMKAARAEQGTDIRGALHYAGLSLRGQERRARGLILVTDLEEYIPRGRVPATPKLSGICVMVLSMMTPTMAANPDSLVRLESVWTQRMRGWGAKRVQHRSVLGFDPSETAAYFEDCGDN